MPDFEAYQEYIQRRHNAFCKAVIRYAARDKILQLRRKWERQISLDYLMDEKFVQFAGPEPDEEYPLLTMMQEKLITIQMTDYSGFEKVGALGTSLPTTNSQTTTQSGDIVLYQGNQIVIFYGSNSWSYTRLGKIDDLTGWEDALGSGDVTVTFSD